MSYEINRVEECQNCKDQTELFFSVMITDELGTYPFARWLTPTEFQQYTNDNDTLSTIIDGYLPLAKTVKQEEIDYVPPTE